MWARYITCAATLRDKSISINLLIEAYLDGVLTQMQIQGVYIGSSSISTICPIPVLSIMPDKNIVTPIVLPGSVIGNTISQAHDFASACRKNIGTSIYSKVNSSVSDYIAI